MSKRGKFRQVKEPVGDEAMEINPFATSIYEDDTVLGEELVSEARQPKVRLCESDRPVFVLTFRSQFRSAYLQHRQQPIKEIQLCMVE